MRLGRQVKGLTEGRGGIECLANKLGLYPLGHMVLDLICRITWELLKNTKTQALSRISGGRALVLVFVKAFSRRFKRAPRVKNAYSRQ